MGFQGSHLRFDIDAGRGRHAHGFYLQLSDTIEQTGAVGRRNKGRSGDCPLNPFIEKYFAKIANLYFPGSAHGQLPLL